MTKVRASTQAAGADQVVQPFLDIPAELIRAQVEKILASDIFIRSERMSRFLRFTVEQTLQGNGDKLKEYLIGIEVYDKPESLDPRFDPIVRVEAGRLRSKLREYYETEGRNDPVIIGFRKRSYAAVFEAREARLLQNPALPGFQPPAAETAESEARQSENRNSGDPNSIAVLPFADMSRRGDQEYFCDGLTEELINALTRVDGLRVVARTSVFQFKGKADDIRKIGQRLNVGTVLEGSVRKCGQKLRITAQLNNVSDGYHLWSETFDREISDTFGLQEEISQSIAQKFQKFRIARWRLGQTCTLEPVMPAWAAVPVA